MKIQRHIHIENDKKGWYSQNYDGSPHDKNKNGPGSGPPKDVKKKLKDKSGWDWDKKINDYSNKQIKAR